MNAFAHQESSPLVPRNAILLDCQTALTAIKAAAGGIETGETSARELRGLIQQLHALKGAAGMVGMEGLSGDLHELEGGLAALLRQPPERRRTGMLSEPLANAQARMSPTPLPSRPDRQKIAYKPLGDALWWSSQMVQVTAKELGKRVFLLIKGGNIRIPQAHFDVLQTNLQHLTRNAVVHGIEQPEVRVQSGKPALGLIRIYARRLHGSVVVNVIDNGAGVRTGAGRNPFQMGVSTIDGVTPSAGRGIGLSAVKDACVAKGGTVSMHSVQGKGTAFTMRLPY